MHMSMRYKSALKLELRCLLLTTLDNLVEVHPLRWDAGDFSVHWWDWFSWLEDWCSGVSYIVLTLAVFSSIQRILGRMSEFLRITGIWSQEIANVRGIQKVSKLLIVDGQR